PRRHRSREHVTEAGAEGAPGPEGSRLVTDTALAPISQPTSLAPIGAQAAASAIEAVVIKGDLAQLTPAQRVDYYRALCESLGLNPFTRPFDYINLNNKLTLYPK